MTGIGTIADLRIPPDRSAQRGNGPAGAATYARTVFARLSAQEDTDLARWAAQIIASLGIVLSRWGRQHQVTFLVLADQALLHRRDVAAGRLAQDVRVIRLAIADGAGFGTLVDQAALGLAVGSHRSASESLVPIRLAWQSKLDVPELGPGLAFAFSAVDRIAACAYDSSRYISKTAERLLAQTRSVIDQGTRDLGLPLSKVTLLAAGERDLILGSWSRGAPAAADFPLNVNGLISDQAEARPDAVAVVCGQRKITYYDLVLRSRALARRLHAMEIGREDRVGVFLGRTADLIVAYLGVLQAGAAYVPIDPAQPTARQDLILADCGARAIITDGALPRSPFDTAATVIQVADIDTAIDSQSLADRKRLGVQPEDLAYVIYTSGSAGTPKGVQVEHRNLLYSTLARLDFFDPPYSSYLALAGPSFDALGAGIYLTLCTGGKLVLPTDDEVIDPWMLVELMEREQVTHFDGVPAQYDVVLEVGATSLTHLRCAVVGGEVCPASLVQLHAATLPANPLINEYGPTEATIWATAFRWIPGSHLEGAVPIGRPIRGARAYVLDERLEPVPAGVPGELYIGGVGVARGYLGNQELTKQHFLPDPFGAPGDRLYRTGDVVRWRYDSYLEFLGRADAQVKIRGFRVEPGEVEAVLLAHPGVREAAVLTVPFGPHQEPILAAYFSGRDGATPPIDDLVGFAARRLPSYMVPSAWMPLDAIPRTRHGKVDQRALPPPERTPRREQNG